MLCSFMKCASSCFLVFMPSMLSCSMLMLCLRCLLFAGACGGGGGGGGGGGCVGVAGGIYSEYGTVVTMQGSNCYLFNMKMHFYMKYRYEDSH